MSQAARIAINRTVAGVHYPVDSAVGKMLGISIAKYLIARCEPAGSASTPTKIEAWKFDGAKCVGTDDFSGAELFDPTCNASNPGGKRKSQSYADTIKDSGGTVVECAVRGSDNLNWLWKAAVAEWA
jgi:hypothetical protein